MSEGLKKYCKLASLIYPNILYLNHCEIRRGYVILHWNEGSAIYEKSQCSFTDDLNELKIFFDELIS